MYGLLCDLIEANHPLIVGPQNSNIPRLIAVLAEIYAKEALPVSHPVSQRAVAILKQIQVSAITLLSLPICVNHKYNSPEAFSSCVGTTRDPTLHLAGNETPNEPRKLAV